jgi:hypothetical protein
MSQDPGQNLGQNPGQFSSQSLIDGLAGIAITPLTLRQIFVLLTRAHYSNPANFGAFQEKMSQFVWHQDPTRSRLFVDYDWNYDPANKDRRPAIFVGTGDVKFMKMVAGNLKEVTEDRAGSVEANLGAIRVVLRHIGATPNDSLALGEMSQQFFQLIRKLMLEKAKLHSYDVTGLLSSRPFQKGPAEADKEFVCDLTIDLLYNSVWMTLVESHPIKTVGFAQSLVNLVTTR